jgi:hypothetical protein
MNSQLSFGFNDVVISNLVRVIFLCPTLTDQSPSAFAVRRYSETETETETGTLERAINGRNRNILKYRHFGPFWGELGPLMTPFGDEFGHFGVNSPHLGDQVVSATKKVGRYARHGPLLSPPDFALQPNSTWPKKNPI